MPPKTFATLSLAALLMSAPGFAELPLKATIPFDFTVGTTRMAAGEYTFTYSMPGVVRISSPDWKASCLVLTMPVETRKAAETGKLVFNRYGATHFLSQIWGPGSGRGREVYKSRAEREMARNAAGVQRASVFVKPRHE
ncbi:MAG: hypothetical protein HUU41_08545 [Bryobacteraceae bacterium]|nr:hypothetical protein [Bryobacterales bacterium]NUN01149.1 hypothetical protein [Bryobacteraceae bacterium]